MKVANEERKERELKARERNEAERNERELLELLKPVDGWTGEDATPEARERRLAESDADFWAWDAYYYPTYLYDDYAPSGQFHRNLVSVADCTDKCAHIWMGPRECAKTVTMKKKFVYNMLHGKRKYMALGGETLLPAMNALEDIMTFIDTNDRIKYDYSIVWLQASQNALFIKTNMNKHGTYVSPVSLDRSTKAMQRNVSRLDFVYVTDAENITSSLTKDAIAQRIAWINEARTSLTKNGTLLWEGNNFDPRCAMNHLLTEQERGILSEYFILHIYPAWGVFPSNGNVAAGFTPADVTLSGVEGSVWPERYPATSEAEMKSMCKPMDEYDWCGNYQQKPRIKSGDIFPDTFYQEWKELPDDLKGVIYADQNCSLKGKGDTTAVTALAWSPSTMSYYVYGAHCKSYSNPNKLLMDIIVLRGLTEDIVSGRHVGFDGNVSQEATWTNNVRNFVQINEFPFPPIHYKKYKVDDITKGVQSVYQDGKLFFPPGFRILPEGKEYTDQLFAFQGKKAGKTDDAPDSLVCAFELLTEIFHPSKRNKTDKPIQCFSKRSNTGKL